MHIVQNSIYGVDIEKGAVDIARLRFWLSIVVDAVKPEPLPNLDYKIMQGNSLIESYRNTDLSHLLTTVSDCLFDADTDQIVSLQKAIQGYYLPHDNKAKEKIQEEIKEKVIAIVKERLPDPKVISDLEQIDLHANQKFFLWHTWFCDVFNRPSKDGSAGGFDIVIGNPPYGAKVSEEEKKYYREHYAAAKTENGIKGSTDTFTVFIEMGHDLLKTGGNLAFIVPMSVTSSDAMCSLHNKIEKDCGTIMVSSYSNRPQQIFDAACVRTSILMLNKNGKKLEHLYTTKLVRRNKNNTIQGLIDSLEFVDSIKLKMPGRYAKVGTKIEVATLTKSFSFGKNIAYYKNENGKPFYYRTSALCVNIVVA